MAVRGQHLEIDTFATRVYVVGEVLVSLIVLLGGFWLVFFSGEESVKLVGSGAITGATTFWFSRRQAEQSNNALAHVANGKLQHLVDQYEAQQASIQALVSVAARKSTTS